MKDLFKNVKKAVLTLGIFGICFFVGNTLDVNAGNCGGHVIGYTCPGHGHTIQSDRCSQCGGSGTIAGHKACAECGKQVGFAARQCPVCGSTSFRITPDKTCSHCAGTGVVYRCTNERGCALSSWGYYSSDKRNGTCYTDNCTPVYGDHEAAAPATCTTPSTCRYCGVTLQNALGHAESDWQFDIPGYHRKVCTRCGIELLRGQNIYYVAYNANGGYESIGNQTVTYEQTFNLAVNQFWRPGYTFQNYCYQGVGWFASGQAVNRLTTGHGTTVTMDAQWSANNYTVTFNGNGGTPSTKNKVVTYNGTYGTLPTATRTGYDFVGWFNSPGDKVNSYQNPSAIYNGVDYSAVYNYDYYCAANADVKAIFGGHPQEALKHFVENGMSEGRRASENFDVSYYRNQNPDLSSAFGNNAKSYYLHYISSGQYENRVTAQAKQITAANQVTTPFNHNLYAHWKIKNYNVAYNGNGGNTSAATQTKAYGEYADLSQTAAKDGYIFIGWNTDPNAKYGYSTYKIPDIGASGSMVTLYAIYSIPVSDIHVSDADDIAEVFIETHDKTHPDIILGIQKMEETGKNVRTYTFHAGPTNIAFGLTNYGNVGYCIKARDNAGNIGIIYKPDDSTPVTPDAKYYDQTVKHMTYNLATKKYDVYKTVSKKVLEGTTYKPEYIGIAGFVPEKMEPSSSAYTVTKAQTTCAYYAPQKYTLYYDANGGTCSVGSKSISYGENYGDMPTPEREGYTFLGWFTEKEDGTQVRSTDIYSVVGDSTIYAHWKVNTYKVFYDYQTNGGTAVSMEIAEVPYGQDIDLSVVAQKEGWSHIGWNINPAETTGMSKITMGTENMIVYAIYQKHIVGTFIDYDNNGTVTRNVETDIYNQEKTGKIKVPKENEKDGWTCEGWSLKKDANATPDTVDGANYSLGENKTFYGLYSKKIHVTYETGIPETPEEQTGIRNQNASGEDESPEFTLADAPQREGYSFDKWVDENGNEYLPKEKAVFDEDVILTAKWDKYPEIEAYDRYFTLEQAQTGQISKEELLKKASAMDEEDGVITDKLLIPDYSAEEFGGFTDDGNTTVTYSVTDSFGNTTTKTVKVYIVDSTAKDADLSYIRYIDKDYFKNNEGYVNAENGGLEEYSKWKTDETYNSALEYSLNNQRTNEEKTTVKIADITKEVTKAGTGNWGHKKSTWKFSKKEIDEVEKFVTEHGYSRYKESNATEKFYEQFGNCIK